MSWPQAVVEIFKILAKTGRIFGHYGNQVHGFYVHPKTGLLCEQIVPSLKQRMKAKEALKPVTEIKISNTERYEKVDGIWYYIEDRTEYYKVMVTVVQDWRKGLSKTQQMIKEVEAKLDGETLIQKVMTEVERERRIHNQHQLNRKELKKLQLKNDLKEARPLSRRESRRRLTK